MLVKIYETFSKLENYGYKIKLGKGKIKLELKDNFPEPDPGIVEPLFEVLRKYKPEAIKLLSLPEEEAFDKYIEELREQNRYDPRPDLVGDHELWQAVLKKAEKANKQVYGNLHGFRIAGCRLKLENDRVKLLPGKALGDYWPYRLKWKVDRQEYLLPYKKEIKEIFDTAAQKLAELQ